MNIEKLGFTPGPWEDSEGMGYIFANRIGGCTMTMQKMTVANTRGYGCLLYHGEDKAHAEMEANEKLIAAAPDMLDLLINNCIELEESSRGRGEIEESYDPIFKKIGTSWDAIKELST